MASCLMGTRGQAESLGFISGAVAGLVAITPAAGYVTPMSAIVIGAVAGVMRHFIMLWRQGRGIDESLDAWAVHGMGGLWGALATGIFASAAVNGASGLIEGNVHQFIAQIVGAGSAVIYAFVVTYISCSHRGQNDWAARDRGRRICRA